MAIHNLITLSSSTPTRLTPRGTHSGMDITIQNVNLYGYIYLGGETTLSEESYGYRVSPGHAISFELPGSDSIYAVASDEGMKIAVLQTNLESGH